LGFGTCGGFTLGTAAVVDASSPYIEMAAVVAFRSVRNVPGSSESAVRVEPKLIAPRLAATRYTVLPVDPRGCRTAAQ
jgi:hypothetical protein